MAGIRVHDVRKTYEVGDGAVKVALEDVNLDIADGEFVCFLGPSGGGKTTLLNILSGLDKDYQGSVQFTGANPGQLVARPKMSYVFQESRLLPWMSVRENIRFVLETKESRDRSNERIDSWLARVGLAGYGAYYPMQLSIGMQQRVSVARALILEPGLLFMDEPFSALDELTALKVRQELLELWAQQGCTVVFVTHNPLEAVYLADRVLIMTPSPGRISFEMNLRTLLPRPRDPEDPRLWKLSREAVRKLMGGDKSQAVPTEAEA